MLWSVFNWLNLSYAIRKLLSCVSSGTPVVFIMPGEASLWKMNIHIDRHDNVFTWWSIDVLCLE